MKEFDFKQYGRKYNIDPATVFSTLFGGSRADREIIKNGMAKINYIQWELINFYFLTTLFLINFNIDCLIFKLLSLLSFFKNYLIICNFRMRYFSFNLLKIIIFQVLGDSFFFHMFTNKASIPNSNLNIFEIIFS